MRVTTRGFGLFFGSAALAAGGLWFGYPELTVLGCAGLLAVVAALAVPLRGWQLSVHRTVNPIRLARGSVCQGVLQITNNARFLGTSLYATDHCQLRSGAVAVPIPLVRLAATKSSTVHYALPTDQRGLIVIGPLTVERRDLLGLVRTQREYGGTRTIWVHPRVHPVRAIPAGTARSLDGLLDKVEHGSITFHALREYVAGDDLRHVHWRTTAHVGELMVREHLDTSLPRIVVLLDDRADAYPQPAGFEEAVEVAASVLVAVLHAGLAVDLHTATGTLISSTQTTLREETFLDALTEIELAAVAGPAAGMAETAQRLRHGKPGSQVGDTLVVITGSQGQQDLDAIAGLRAVFPSIVVGVLGQAESAQPLPGGAASQHGMLVITAVSAAEFVGAWEGVRA